MLHAFTDGFKQTQVSSPSFLLKQISKAEKKAVCLKHTDSVMQDSYSQGQLW